MDIHFSDAWSTTNRHNYQIMAKPSGSACNLNCTYCYYLEKRKLYPNNASIMKSSVLEQFVKEYINSIKAETVNFVWQGGEPALAGLDFYKMAVFFQQKYRGRKKITNAFQTNGTLLNDEWCKFFSRYNFLVGISIDGPENIHNHYRKNKANKGSFDSVMESIRLLRKWNIPFNTLSVVNDYTSHFPSEIYSFLKTLGTDFMQFLPVVEQHATSSLAEELQLVSPQYENETEVTEWSVQPGMYSQFLIALFNEWVKKDVGRYFIQIFDATLANWAGKNPGLCAFEKTCGGAAVLEHNGDVYSCDHFVYPENYLGNIQTSTFTQMIHSKKQNEFGFSKHYNLPEQCMHCDYLFACRGGCPKNRIVETVEKDKKLNYLCKDYKQFFRHVTPYMNFMVGELSQKRPPANVMDWSGTIHAQ